MIHFPLCRTASPPTMRPARLRVLARSLTTESAAHTSPVSPPPLPQKPENTKPRPPRLYPRPRPATPSNHRVLPATFGRNQLLPVPSSTRALLERIVGSFNAPIRYAFAYGSGVFGQAGYEQGNKDSPMLDFVFAVTHPDHWHSMNLHQHPGHYPLHARALGSSYVATVQELGPGLWFNTFVPMHGVVGWRSSDHSCTVARLIISLAL